MNIRNIIKEEMDDFGWARGPINPWSEYDAIRFDITPKAEDVKRYINSVLTSNKEIGNKEVWSGDQSNTIKAIIYRVKEYGESILLGVEDSALSYGVEQWWDLKNLKVVDYSQIK
jgi:hypothetical protein